MYQSTTIPIPRFERVDHAVTFIGRLANEILRMTDTRFTTYIDQMSAWYDKRTTQEILNLKLWHQLKEAVDIFGLSALDRLFCFMIVRELQTFLRYLQRYLMKSEQFFRQLKGFVKVVDDPNALIREF